MLQTCPTCTDCDGETSTRMSRGRTAEKAQDDLGTGLCQCRCASYCSALTNAIVGLSQRRHRCLLLVQLLLVSFTSTGNDVSYVVTAKATCPERCICTIHRQTNLHPYRNTPGGCRIVHGASLGTVSPPREKKSRRSSVRISTREPAAASYKPTSRKKPPFYTHPSYIGRNEMVVQLLGENKGAAFASILLRVSRHPRKLGG